MLISLLTAISSFAGSRDGRQDLLREALELRLLVVADEADAEVGHAGVRVALQRADHRIRRPEPHQSTLVDTAAVVGRQELARGPLGARGIVVQAHRRVDAERKRRQRAAVPVEGLLGQRAQAPALVGVALRPADALAQPRESLELRGQELPTVALRDEA